RRGLGQTTELYVIWLDVQQRPALLIVEMVVRRDVRIEPGAVSIHVDLTNQPAGREQVQRVVDGGLRDARAGAPQGLGDLLGGQMPWRLQQQARDLQTLLGDPDTAGRQPLCGRTPG